jgi:diguanylate cyclase (GGDEF)-like protein/PAS domain S-box-containing protein
VKGFAPEIGCLATKIFSALQTDTCHAFVGAAVMGKLTFSSGLGFGRKQATDERADATGTPPDESTVSTGKRRLRSTRWAVLSCGVVLIAAIVSGTAIAILSLHDRELAHAEREMKNIALILAANTNNTFEKIERVQTSLVEKIQELGIARGDDFEQKMSGYDAHLMLNEKILGLPHVGSFTLINAQGRVFNFSRSWPVPEIDVTDRSFFKALQSDKRLTFFISEPMRNRATGSWVMHFARKISGPNGEFLGVLSAAIELEKFEEDFLAVTLWESGSISLQRNDGVMVVRAPRIEWVIGRTFTGVIGSLGNRNHGTVRLVGRMDNKDRLLASHRLANYPFILTVGVDVAFVLSNWRRDAYLLAGVGLLSCVLVAFATILLVRTLAQEQNWSKQRLALEKFRLDTAVNNMTQGLLLFDSSERIVVCNRRYIEMYGLSPDVVKPGLAFRDLIAHRRDTGSFIGDIEAYRLALLRDLAQGTATQRCVETADGRSIQIVNKPLADGGWVSTHEDITERKQSEERIAYLAHYDSLTGLPNRVLFRGQLEEALKRVRRGERLAVFYLDLDHFKSINDTLGHPVGDELLKAVASRLRSCLRETDIVARLGGDEFAIVQTGIADPTDIIDLANRIHEAFKERFEVGGHVVSNTSIGIAMAPEDATEPDHLLKCADLALYGAKEEGRGTYRFFEPDMDARAKVRRALEFDLREAIMCGGFELHYQPLVNLRDGTISGCEALLRWHHPKRGTVSPAEFIPVAEETGLITQLGEWVLRTACAEAANWPGDLKIAINVSPPQFKSQALAPAVIGALAASGLPADRLELEITEAVLIRNDATVLVTLKQLRELGVRIAMDDFGTGYSSLSYLQRFAFDKIKIDRTFIKDIAEPDGSYSIVQAVVNIAESRGITTTAEGVETERQMELVRELGCTEMQGDVFSPAMPAAQLAPLIRSCRESVTKVA